MTDIITLLTLPKTSHGFTAHRATVVDVTDVEGSASHPHKTPRLDADSDSGSASRSRNHINKRKDVERNGPLRIHVQDFTAKALDVTYNNLFALLRACIRVLLTRTTLDVLPATYERIYNACGAIVCVADRGEALYDVLRMELDQCSSRLLHKLNSVEGGRAIDWLDGFVHVCTWYERQVALLRSLLAYLDRAFVLKNPRRLSIRKLAYETFQHRILSVFQVIDPVRESVSQWLTWERTERKAHDQRHCIQELVSHLITHDMYDEILEGFITAKTHTYYSDEAQQMIVKLKVTAEQFLAHVTERVAEEMERASALFRPSTVTLLQKAARQGLLDGRLEWLAKDAIGPLMNLKNTDRLSATYTEFVAVDALNVLCKEFKGYVLTTVVNIVKDDARDDEMVERLLEFKTFSDKALQAAFVDSKTQHPNQGFAYALTDAFTLGFKARRNKPAELIARHVDRLMRRGQRDMADSEFDAVLDAVLALYRYTDDKDVFRTFYHRALARRLLLERSASDDFEKAMLKKLKEKYDPEFGMGDHMFNDLALSRDILREFHNRISGSSSAQRLSVMVLQRSVWPFAARKKDVDLPPTMLSDLNSFSIFYKNKHQGHKLDWDHSLGTATLKAKFSAGPKDLTVSLYQAVVLLLFNDESEIGYKQILEATRMEEAELKRILQSLACGNKKVLKKRPVGKDVNEDDMFCFNAEFTHPRAKVHINSIQAKESAEESKRTQSHIEGDRKHYLDAAIVRIMKAKKELSYEQLKTQTIDAVKTHFVPEVSVIKQRISGLVEQEYLRRDDDDMNRYIYVA
ncbi:Cullin-4B [Phlebopus sp. FC_14]|nr:Cullin-4B [Phlebopus sp. FC_14]